MFVGAVSSVEGVLARLNLLEAHQQDLLMQNTELKTELATQKTELAQQKAETAQLKDQLEQAEFGNLTQGSASPPPVSFHASLSRTAHVPAHYPIILDHVYNNEGDAYSPANGSFTVPFNGTYFFIASTGTENARNQDAWMRLVVDHEFVGYTIPRHSDC
nr:hypothetical protein BaRGS_020641 [Batillaria attramentaria]